MLFIKQDSDSAEVNLGGSGFNFTKTLLPESPSNHLFSERRPFSWSGTSCDTVMRCVLRTCSRRDETSSSLTSHSTIISQSRGKACFDESEGQTWCTIISLGQSRCSMSRTSDRSCAREKLQMPACLPPQPTTHKDVAAAKVRLGQMARQAIRSYTWPQFNSGRISGKVQAKIKTWSFLRNHMTSSLHPPDLLDLLESIPSSYQTSLEASTSAGR